MKYYSRSPEEARQNIKDSGRSKIRKWANIILFADIVLIVIVFMYMDNRQRSETITLNTAKEFSWQGHQIKGDCSQLQTCSVRIGRTEQASGLNEIQLLVKEAKQNLVFQQYHKHSPDNDLSFDLPVKLTKNHQAYLKALDNKRKELFQIRVYP